MPAPRETQTHQLAADSAGERLDVFLTHAIPELSRSRAQKLIEAGLVYVAGLRAKPSQRLNASDPVQVTIPPPEEIDLAPEELPLDIVYQDQDIIVVDKPAGMAVHPAPGHPRGTLVNAILAICSDLSGIGGALRPGIVHRLDKDTSGLLVVAKTDRAHQSLSRQLKGREVEKTYLALAEGTPQPPSGMIDAPIGRHPLHRQKMAVLPGGRAAQTRYRVLETIGGYSLIEAKPITGRTHQIRVHLASIGCPLLGDSRYGKRSPYLERQFLHAHKLAFILPGSGQRVEFAAPLPPDLEAALERVREDAAR